MTPALERVLERWVVHARLAGRNRARADVLLERAGDAFRSEIRLTPLEAALLCEDARQLLDLAKTQHQVAHELHRHAWSVCENGWTS